MYIVQRHNITGPTNHTKKIYNFLVLIEKSRVEKTCFKDFFLHCFYLVINLPIQHSNLAQGCVLTISGGSTPTFKQSTKATLTVFI